MQSENINLLNSATAQAGSETLAKAFIKESMHSYIFSNEIEKKKLPNYFFFLINYTIKYGYAFTTSPKNEGVCLLLPSSKAHITLWRGLRCGGYSFLKQMGKDTMSRIDKFEEVFAIHKNMIKSPHWYLMTLGVDPSFQRKGYGGILMKRILKRVDRDNLPCYLDTNDEENIGFYNKYGFQVINKQPLTNTNVINWSMLRQNSL